MWVLTTDRAELRQFPQPPPRYAILSHVWRKKPPEQSFDDLQEIHKRCKRTGEHPFHFVSKKIRRCCMWAAEHGFHYVWIDTCCIDKTSSAELSEAINSMYFWYRRATICYTYLHDVSVRDSPFGSQSAFRRSRWFTRGWTLQELIAPKDVIFLSREWKPITTKRASPALLTQITAIDAAVLVGDRALSWVSVAERLSWAARRETTKVEDEAYCLMGLFGVNMPTIYGEGREAFLRLQEEIMRRIPDFSLLVWGPRLGLVETVAGHIDRIGRFPSTEDHAFITQSLILAQRPSAFDFSGTASGAAARIKSLPVSQFVEKHGIPYQVPQLTLTSYGFRVNLPIVRLPNDCDVALIPCQVDGFTVALVLRYQGLSPGPWAIGNRVVPNRPFDNCTHFDPGSQRPLPTCEHLSDVRYVLLPPNLETLYPAEAFPTWETVYLAYRDVHVRVQDPLTTSESPPPHPLHNLQPKAVTARRHKIFLPPWVVGRLAKRGFFLTSSENRLGATANLRAGEKSVFVFTSYDWGQQLIVDMESFRTSHTSYGRAWCTVSFLRIPPATGGHDDTLLAALSTPVDREFGAGPSDPASFYVSPSSPSPKPGPSGGYIDGWGDRWRYFKNDDKTVVTRLRFVRMGDLPVGDLLWDCHVYQIDISLRFFEVAERATTPLIPFS